MNEFEKTNEQTVSKGNKRRSFLKKSATGAVVFSLPAKSVWGACSVSGAMSGNLSTNRDRHDCTMPIFSASDQGAGASTWKNFDTNVSTDANGNLLFSYLASKFGVFSDADYKSLKGKYVMIVDDLKTKDLELPSELISPSITCGEALMSTNPNINRLGAVFLNVSLDVYASSFDAIQLVNDIFLYIYTTEAQTGVMTLSLSDSDFGITDPSSKSPLVIS